MGGRVSLSLAAASCWPHDVRKGPSKTRRHQRRHRHRQPLHSDVPHDGCDRSTGPGVTATGRELGCGRAHGKVRETDVIPAAEGQHTVRHPLHQKCARAIVCREAALTNLCWLSDRDRTNELGDNLVRDFFQVTLVDIAKKNISFSFTTANSDSDEWYAELT